MDSTLKCSASQVETGKRNLPEGYVPGDYDVVCGKGKTCFLHPGNKYFRKLVGFYLDTYSEAPNKMEKSGIVSVIIRTVRSRSPVGGFVKLDSTTGRWQEVGDHLAREKVGQTIRDALHSQYRSSSRAKKRRRQAEQATADNSMTMITNNHYAISSKIDELMTKVAASNQSDEQLTEMFTQVNLEILNELNRLNQLQKDGGNLSQTPMDEAPPPPTQLVPIVTVGLPSEEEFLASSLSLPRIFSHHVPYIDGTHLSGSSKSITIPSPPMLLKQVSDVYTPQEWEDSLQHLQPSSYH